MIVSDNVLHPSLNVDRLTFTFYINQTGPIGERGKDQ